MKMMFFFLSIFFLGSIFAQKGDIEQKYSARRDSVIVQTKDQSVYITRDTSFVEYDWFAGDFERVDEMDKEYFDSIVFRHYDLKSLHTRWSPIHKYNGKWYVYSPSDWLFSQNMLITDSLVYFVSSDMSWGKLNSFQNIDSSSFEFTYPDYSNKIKRLVLTYLFESNNNIAKIEIYDDEGLVDSYFMVHVEDVRNYPMIVNECFDKEGNDYYPMKCFREFDF